MGRSTVADIPMTTKLCHLFRVMFPLDSSSKRNVITSQMPSSVAPCTHWCDILPHPPTYPVFLSCLCWDQGHISLLFCRSYAAGAGLMLCGYSALRWTGLIWGNLRHFEKYISMIGTTSSSPKSVFYLSGHVSSVPSLLCNQVWPWCRMSRSDACHFWAEVNPCSCSLSPGRKEKAIRSQRRTEPQEGRSLGYWSPGGKMPSQKIFIGLQYGWETNFYCVKPSNLGFVCWSS